MRLELEQGIFYEGEVNACGKPHGKGVLSDESGEIYDGNFVNGRRWGYGIEYDTYGYPSYAGEWQDDVRCGHGSEYICGKIVFEGEYRADKANGFGRSFDDEGEILEEGVWKDDVFQG